MRQRHGADLARAQGLVSVLADRDGVHRSRVAVAEPVCRVLQRQGPRRAARRRGVLLPGRGARRDRGLAGGLQHAPAASARWGCAHPPCSPPRWPPSTSRSPWRRDPGGCRRGARRGYRRYGTRYARASATTAAGKPPRLSVRRRALPSPPSHPPPSHPWWTDKRGPVTRGSRLSNCGSIKLPAPTDCGVWEKIGRDRVAVAYPRRGGAR